MVERVPEGTLEELMWKGSQGREGESGYSEIRLWEMMGEWRKHSVPMREQNSQFLLIFLLHFSHSLETALLPELC